MAKKQLVQLPVSRYYVISDKVGSKLGPYPVVTHNNQRVVMLNEKQAKFYLTTGVISEYPAS